MSLSGLLASNLLAGMGFIVPRQMKIFDTMSKQKKTKAETTPDENGKIADNMKENNGNTSADNQSVAGENHAETGDVVAELTKKCDELNDKYLRLYSEFDNYRKRIIKEKSDLSKTANEEVISSLLPVLDDFERAIGTFNQTESIEPVKEGVLLIYNKLRNNLAQKGLQETEAMGLDFNTDFHEAIANLPAPAEEQKNKVLDVTQKGYTLNGKVIRFAKVVVGN